MPKRDKHIKQYKLKNGDVRYMFHAYLGKDPVTEQPIQITKRKFATYNVKLKKKERRINICLYNRKNYVRV